MLDVLSVIATEFKISNVLNILKARNVHILKENHYRQLKKKLKTFWLSVLKNKNFVHF